MQNKYMNILITISIAFTISLYIALVSSLLPEGTLRSFIENFSMLSYIKSESILTYTGIYLWFISPIVWLISFISFMIYLLAQKEALQKAFLKSIFYSVALIPIGLVLSLIFI